ncbi:unnamed protein product [Spirodela intermedia]|uniref:Uncharacterized protein n=1 Tax=Spirodela intermedia TaxID=51605 RepID=A0A7I8JKL5_SPIIN|nr:unnamed protein product [Spirodela intermedia]CAA6670736.1 unnamed protein product [Spirodela intermedia]
MGGPTSQPGPQAGRKCSRGGAVSANIILMSTPLFTFFVNFKYIYFSFPSIKFIKNIIL